MLITLYTTKDTGFNEEAIILAGLTGTAISTVYQQIKSQEYKKKYRKL